MTGTDTDRLPDEKRRGITIDLGFADLEIGDLRLGFVDVPGHERFVKNMLAGASGIDVVLLVIAADEGIMPQTREHFDICRLLQIKKGLIALTKKDLVDNEMLELVRAETDQLVHDTFLDGAPVIAVSSRTGEGIEELKAALVSMAGAVRSRTDDLITRLHIDRSFSMKGFGAVVTGTLASGKITEGAELELLPTSRILRVRGVQSHGKRVSETNAGRRTAVNLVGIDRSEIERGMLLVEPHVLQPAQMYDAEIEVLENAARPLRTRQRVRVHIGTVETLARVAVIGAENEIETGEKGFVQLRLESPVAAISGERFIIRSYSPQMTIGGGAIVRRATEKFRKREVSSLIEFLSRFVAAHGDNVETLKLLVEYSNEHGSDVSEIRSITGWRSHVLATAVAELLARKEIIDCDGVFLGATRRFGDRIFAHRRAARARYYSRRLAGTRFPVR